MADDPTTPGEIVGRNIRAARERQLLSQRELHERSGVAKITIATLELGRSAHPRRRTVEKLADALGVPVEELMSTEPPAPKGPAPPSQDLRLFNNGILEKEEERRRVRDVVALRDKVRDLIHQSRTWTRAENPLGVTEAEFLERTDYLLQFGPHQEEILRDVETVLELWTADRSEPMPEWERELVRLLRVETESLRDAANELRGMVRRELIAWRQKLAEAEVALPPAIEERLNQLEERAA
jgi:transcriptional regulator with XRE-family HTH domain